MNHRRMPDKVVPLRPTTGLDQLFDTIFVNDPDVVLTVYRRKRDQVWFFGWHFPEGSTVRLCEAVGMLDCLKMMLHSEGFEVTVDGSPEA